MFVKQKGFWGCPFQLPVSKATFYISNLDDIMQIKIPGPGFVKTHRERHTHSFTQLETCGDVTINAQEKLPSYSQGQWESSDELHCPKRGHYLTASTGPSRWSLNLWQMGWGYRWKRIVWTLPFLLRMPWGLFIPIWPASKRKQVQVLRTQWKDLRIPWIPGIGHSLDLFLWSIEGGFTSVLGLPNRQWCPCIFPNLCRPGW